MSNKSLDGVLTKKAHQREKFDETGIEELKKCVAYCKNALDS